MLSALDHGTVACPKNYKIRGTHSNLWTGLCIILLTYTYETPQMFKLVCVINSECSVTDLYFFPPT